MSVGLIQNLTYARNDVGLERYGQRPVKHGCNINTTKPAPDSKVESPLGDCAPWLGRPARHPIHLLRRLSRQSDA
eukprot:2832613-Alexandrium_andersonii.AAC.1